MILYLDTSALVKVYIKESFSDIVRDNFLNADKIAISIIGYVEFYSALNRLFRENHLTKSQLKKVISNFKSHWQQFSIVDLENVIINRASELITFADLRAFDSIHLASAEFIKNNSMDNLIFGCFDKRLMNGAKKIGLSFLLNSGEF